MKVNYRQLIELIAKKDGFDAQYTINNLSVKEVFYNNYITNTEKWLNWNDKADRNSIQETMGIVNRK